MTNLGTSGALRFFAVVLITLVGLVHLVTVQGHLIAAPWVGWAFAANFLAALVAGAWILQDIWFGWVLGFLVAAGAFAAYIISRAVGLPGFNEGVGRWFGQVGIFSLVVEALFVLLFLAALVRAASR